MAVMEERKVQWIDEKSLEQLIQMPVKQVEIPFDYTDVSLMDEARRQQEAECILAAW